MSDGVDVDLTGCKVVDDVPANLDVPVRALDGEGYNVHVASDGPTAQRRMLSRQLEALQEELQETRKRQLGEKADDA